MTFFRILVVLFLCRLAVPESSCLSAQSLDTFERRTYAANDGTVLPYRILYPRGYDRAAKEKYPLVLFLHGAGERGDDNEAQLVHGAGMLLSDTHRRLFPAIYVFPQCPKNGYWSNVDVDRSALPVDLTFDYTQPPTPALRAVMELMDKLAREECLDKKRYYVMGLSMGGMGTFELVHRRPKTFAAAIPICGGMDTKNYTKKARKTRFWVHHGADDSVVSVEESRTATARLRELGYRDVKYSEYPGVNHNSWDSAFSDPELYPWLFAQRR